MYLISCSSPNFQLAFSVKPSTLPHVGHATDRIMEESKGQERPLDWYHCIWHWAALIVLMLQGGSFSCRHFYGLIEELFMELC